MAIKQIQTASEAIVKCTELRSGTSEWKCWKTKRRSASFCNKSREIEKRTGEIVGTQPGCIFKWAPMLATASCARKN